MSNLMEFLQQLGVKPDAGGDKPHINRPPEGHYVMVLKDAGWSKATRPDDNGNRLDVMVIRYSMDLLYYVNDNDKIMTLSDAEISINKAEAAFFIGAGENDKMMKARAFAYKATGKLWFDASAIETTLDAMKGFVFYARVYHWSNSDKGYGIVPERAMCDSIADVTSTEDAANLLNSLEIKVTPYGGNSGGSVESNKVQAPQPPAPSPAPPMPPSPSAPTQNNTDNTPPAIPF